jgi:hypothetical protein
MASPRLCRFYKETLKTGMMKGPGYCNLDSEQTTCNGDIDLCEKPLSLKRYLFDQLKKQGGLEWKKEEDVRFLEGRKV